MCLPDSFPCLSGCLADKGKPMTLNTVICIIGTPGTYKIVLTGYQQHAGFLKQVSIIFSYVDIEASHF